MFFREKKRTYKKKTYLQKKRTYKKNVRTKIGADMKRSYTLEHLRYIIEQEFRNIWACVTIFETVWDVFGTVICRFWVQKLYQIEIWS